MVGGTVTGAGVVVAGSGVVKGAAVGVGAGGGCAGEVPGGTGVGISVSMIEVPCQLFLRCAILHLVHEKKIGMKAFI